MGVDEVDGYVARIWIWRTEVDPDTHCEGPFDTLAEAREAGERLAEEGWDGYEAVTVNLHSIHYINDPLYPPRYLYEIHDTELEGIL